jgi:thiol peroxidase
MTDAKNTITISGNPMALVGSQPGVGKLAPDFEALTNDMSPFKLSELQGKVLVICSVGSLDTSVCDTEVRKFNEQATSLGDDVAVLVISMDLPFAQKRWCGAAGVKNVQTLSDHNQAQFGNSYGVLIKELRLLGRAVFVVDKKGVIRYIEIVDELTNEPDYEAALNAAKEARK